MIEEIGKDVAFDATEQAVCDRMQIERDSPVFERAMELLETVKRVMNPAYLLKEIAVDGSADGASFGGQRFHSKIVGSKIAGRESVILYIATCGPEIGAYLEAIEDPIDEYVVDKFCHMGYLSAMNALRASLSATHGIDRHITLAPGSIIDWSVAEVKKFFVIADGLYQKIGVRVLESGLIDPLKSGSGVIVRSEEEFESCDICARIDCPSRRTPFSEEKYEAMINLQ